MAALLFVSLVPVVLLGLTLRHQLRTSLHAAAAEHLEQRLELAAAEIDAYVDLHLQVIRATAVLPQITDMDAAQQGPVVAAIAQTRKDFSIFHTVDPRGINVARSDGGRLQDYADRQWYQEPIKGKEVTYQTLVSRTTGKPALAIAVPVQRNGAIVGVLQGSLDLEKASGVVNAVKVGQTGFAWLVDAEGKVMAHPDAERIKQQASAAEHPTVVSARGGATATAAFAEDGRRWLGTQQVLPQGWTLVVQMDEAE
ncbi:MAG: cache domain-containing protein, partial [Chloroflexota bacterium]|nr:cache domain-containing protein [Chloroflexota bacterium]